MTISTQQAFDIDAMLHDLAVEQTPAWAGAPLQYTVAYYSPDELRAAWVRYQFEHGSFGCIPNSHMWHPTVTHDDVDAGTHTALMFTADLGCRCHRPYDARCSCVTAVLHQIICDRCDWHLIGAERDVVEGWHDHAFPGWRSLPIVPATLSGAGRARWVEQHYPDAGFGAPIRTERAGAGSRHVPGRSPWGGYDLAA